MFTDDERMHAAEILKEFNDLNGISGFESGIAARLKERMAPLTDSQEPDTLGNLICIKEGAPGGKKVLLSAHMDEIGFLVLDITDDGFLTIAPVGMHNPAMLTNQIYSIFTRKRGTVYGVVAGGKPVHFAGSQAAPPSVGDLRIDVGCSSAAEVAELGIRVGDPMLIEKESRILNGHYFCGKAVDNRSGIATLIMTMELLKDESLDCSVYACGTVQEEPGIKGMRALGQHLHPDVAIAVDVGFATETGDLNPNSTRLYMGKGPSIQLYDWNPGTCLGNIVPRVVSDGMELAAEHAGVPYQEHVALCCGTDACEISLTGGGVLTGGLSLPERYMHTTVGTIDLDDIIAAARLLAQYCREQ